MYTGFLDAASNREDFTRDFEVTDDDTGDLYDLTDAVINAAISVDGSSDPLLTGSTADGRITIASPGFGSFTLTLSRADMTALPAGTYCFGVTVTLNETTEQLVAATLPVVDGVVAA